jgi:uncharacterized protein YaaQ
MQQASISAIASLVERYRDNVEQLLSLNSVGQAIHLSQTYPMEVAMMAAAVLATESKKLE